MENKVKEIIKVGNSASVILDKELLYKMEAKVGDKLEVVHCTKNKLTFKKHQLKEN